MKDGRRALVCVVVLLAGCAHLHDRGDDYRTAQELPPLKLPPGVETRPIKPLYPIPPGPLPQSWPKKFQAPAPKPLSVPAQTAAPAPAAASAPVQKPLLTQDGNGYPLLSVSGDFNPVWDRLGEALRAAGVKVEDRDQRVGLYYLSLDDETGKNRPYQLRLTRGQSAYTLTLQKDDDTLAPRATSQALFESLVAHWPVPAERP